MGKNGGKKSKSKQTDKNIVHSTSMGEPPSQAQVNVTQDMTVGEKLDALLSVVSDMGLKLKDQDDRLRKQEEKASFHDMSMVPSAHSSPKHVKGGATQQPGTPKPAKLPSFEALKSDSKIQAEVAKRLNEYQDASQIEDKSTSLKSGRFRAGVSKIKIHVN